MTDTGTHRPLHVWVLSDGQPGHYNLSRGIVAALQRAHQLEQHWIDVRLRFGLARNLLRFGLNRSDMPPSAAWLKTVYRMPTLPQAPCDLIVSAGGKTSFANAWLAKRYQAKNLFVGSLRRLSPDLFNLVVSMEPLQPELANNLVLDLPPSAVDPQQLADKAIAFSAQLPGERRPLWLMMIGGNGAGYRYSKEDWQRLGKLVNALAEQYDIQWLLLSSRRTGREGEQSLKSVVRQKHVAATCWYDGDADDCVEQYLGAAEKIFVSEDSMTMITEAIYSQRPVVSLSPRTVASTARYEAMVQRFSEQGRLSRYAIGSLATVPQQLAAHGNTGLSESPLDVLADQLAHHLEL